MAERILNTYTEWQEPEDKLTEEEIRELCCADAEVDPCSEYGKESPWAGEPADPPQDLAPDPKRVKVHVELVGPSGDCGELHEEWTDRNNCCQDATPLEWDYERSAEVVASNSTATVYVKGGAGPYRWTVRGAGFYTDANRRYREAVTDGPSLKLWTTDACGGATVTVTDGCTAVASYIRAADGYWVERDPDACPYQDLAGQYIVSTGNAGTCGLGRVAVEAVVGRWKVLQTFVTNYVQNQVFWSEDKPLNGPAAMAALAAAETSYTNYFPKNLIDPAKTMAAGVVSPLVEDDWISSETIRGLDWQFVEAAGAYGSGPHEVEESQKTEEFGFAWGEISEGCAVAGTRKAWEWVC